MSLIDEALALIKAAKDLEARGKPGRQRPSWSVLEESANKYHEACYLLKQHVRKGGLNQDKKRLLVGHIDQFEPHAYGLLDEAKRLRLADERDQQREQQRKMRSGAQHRGGGRRGETSGKILAVNSVDGNASLLLRRGGSNSPWENEHESRLHTASENTNRGEVTAEDVDRRRFDGLEREAIQAAGDARGCLATAKYHDERGEMPAAIDNYCQAAQSYLHAVNLLSSNDTAAAAHRELMAELKQKVGAILDRVNELKNVRPAPSALRASLVAAPSAPPVVQPSASPDSPAEMSPPRLVDIKQTPQRPKGNANQPDKLTPDEIKVLKWSSCIASGLFLPWSDDEARTFDYFPSKPYVDPDGPLKLSDKQRAKFLRWARPSEIAAMRRRHSSSSSTIVMVRSVTPYTIKQHCVSDCSFVAGLCIAAAHERRCESQEKRKGVKRFDRRLVSSIIHPRDKRDVPIYNPQGLYMVKLWLNGVARRVLVDDFLPVDDRGNLLCSHTTPLGGPNDDNDILELWVPILEKAYMKLCGGYDFPGSNSGVDLFSLTGWIPERLFFPEDPNDVKDFEIPVKRAWERLNSASEYGDCLVTVSTSKDLTEEQAERVGLFTGHAYAVLGVKQTSNGTRLLQLKNPWASKGWKGRFSSRDKDSWRDPEFCREVGYDAATAVRHDDGVFWMSWGDVLRYFRNIHMSWSTDPALFRCRTSIHGYWNKETGPNDDSFNVGDNPQYTVTLSEKAIERKAKLWTLLSRHVTKQEQEGGEVMAYLTQHIHRIKNAKERVYYPNANSVLTGAYTNNQHVLVKYDTKGVEDKFLSIVLSQYKKSDDLGYTLSCYCTEDFELDQPEQPLPNTRQLVGSWKLWDSVTDKSYSLAIGTAGGPQGKGSFGSNPQWSVRVPVGGLRIQVKCMAPKELAVNIILARSKRASDAQQGDANDRRSRRMHHLYEDPIIHTGAYRHGFAVSEVVFVPAGMYTLIASTVEVGQVGRFLLNVLSSKEVEIGEIDQ